MSNLRNRVQLIGHLGADPEVKNFNDQKKIVSLRVATNERYQVNGEWKEETQWHRVVAWNRTAERAEQQLQKGSFCLLEGKLVHRTYEDNQGNKKYLSEVQLHNFVVLDKKSSLTESGGSDAALEDEDQLPF